MSQPAGWYDDPQDTEVLRYWDGVQWTDHTSPRRRPNLGQTSNAPGQGGGPASRQPGDARTADGSSAYGSGQQGTQQQGGQPYGGQQQGQSPYAGSWSQPAPEYAGAAGSRATTPDGQPLAGWWRRFFARILDGLLFVLLWFLLVPLLAPDLFSDFGQFVNDTLTAAESGGSPPTQLPNSINTQVATLSLALGLLALVYEIVMLKVASGTLGKLALGIRVRLRDQPGPLSWGTSVIRGLVWQGPSLLGGVPIVGFLGNLFTLLNALWPLWDSKKQSLNDKVAKTNVVRKA